ncbi:MAG: ABC transporter permease subunit [Clostridia bacterium]
MNNEVFDDVSTENSAHENLNTENSALDSGNIKETTIKMHDNNEINNYKNRSKFADLFASDFYKIGHMKSIIIIPFVMLFLILINYSLFWWQETVLGTANIPDIPELLFTGKIMLFGAGSYILLGLFLGIIFGINIGGEFSNGTISSLVARGSNRLEIYFSKWLTMATIVTMFVLGSFVVCGILTAISGYGAPFNGLEFGYLVRSLVLQTLCNIATGSVLVMVCFLLRTKGGAIAVSLALYFLSNVIISILATIGQLSSGTAWLSELVTYVPGQLLGFATMTGGYTTANILKLVFVPIAYILLTSFVGSYTFLKKDIK